MGEIENKNHWNQTMKEVMEEVEKATSTISMRDLELICCSIDLPMEVCKLIIKEMALSDKLIELLNRHLPLSPEQRFQLALRWGEDVTALDLSHFNGLDNEKLTELQQKCPNLRSLNLSKTPIEKLDPSILHSFSKLEKLDLSQTEIRTLDKLPKSLKELNLSFCLDLTAEEFQKLNSFSKLEKLDVSLTQPH